MSKDIYGGKDPRDLPAYTVREGAHHLRLPQSTLRMWIAGSGARRTSAGPRRSPPVLRAAQRDPWVLSFWNLVEAQLLAAIRRQHTVSMQRVRKALLAVRKELGTDRPLISHDFATDGVDLFVEVYGKVMKASGGMLEHLSEDLHASLERIERDEQGLAQTFYPWARDPREARVVKLDPYVAFGKPVVAGSSVPAAVLAERWESGDSCAHLSEEFSLPAAVIEDAIRWQVGQAA